MNIVLWIVQVILLLMFFMAGFGKVFQYEKTRENMEWVQEASKGYVVFIGLAELLGALGMILPGLTGIVPILTPLAGFGLALIMLFAAIFHFFRKEYQAIGMNVVLLALSLFVAFGRLNIVPF